MLHARITNGEIKLHEFDGVADSPVWKPVLPGTRPDFDQETHRLSGPIYVIEGDRVREVWSADPLTDAEFNSRIFANLDALDRKTIRPLRSKEQDKLDDLEAQAVALRAQLRR